MDLKGPKVAHAAPSSNLAPGNELKRMSSASVSVETPSHGSAAAPRGCRPRRVWPFACIVVLALLLAVAAGLAAFFRIKYEAAVKESRRLEMQFLEDEETPEVVRNETGVLELKTSRQHWLFSKNAMTGAELDAYTRTLLPGNSSDAGTRSMRMNARFDLSLEELGDFPGFAVADDALNDNEEGSTHATTAQDAVPEVEAGGSGSAARKLLGFGRRLLSHILQFGGRPLRYAVPPYTYLNAENFGPNLNADPAAARVRARLGMVKEHAISLVRVVSQDGGRCTGTLVYKNIVLTNAHCLIPEDYPASRPSAADIDGLEVQMRVAAGKLPQYSSAVKFARWSTRYRYRKPNPVDDWLHDYMFLVLEEPLGNVAGWAGVKRMGYEDYDDSKLLPELRGGGEEVQTGLLTIMGFPSVEGEYTCSNTACYQTNLMVGHTLRCRLGHDYYGTWDTVDAGKLLNHQCLSGPGGSGSSLQQHSYQRGWGYVVAMHTWGWTDVQKCATCRPQDCAVPNFLWYSMYVRLRREQEAVLSSSASSLAGQGLIQSDRVPERSFSHKEALYGM